ncbi:MAG: nucleotidyltransferase domain-containing protein [Candidatus Woesearchaeota archaeon]
MAKKEAVGNKKKEEIKDTGKNSNEEKEITNQDLNNLNKLMENLPEEIKNKLKELTESVERLKKRILEKFEDYVIGIALVPAESENKKDESSVDEKNPEEASEASGAKQGLNFNLLVMIDDSDSTKMSKEELKSKISAIIDSFAKEVNAQLKTEILLLSELWQFCLDARYEILKRLALSVPVYEKGMLSAIKISEIHKTMVIKKFERYIVSYVLAGSIVKGRATKESDIDVWIVIDDTDVKRMSRAELKDKLRAIIIGMGIEAGEITGIKNKLNIQVYILTDFWDSLREANPIIFTLLRDGIPLYDRGLFVPWKQLLKMGRIKPSREAIDMFMSTGEHMLKNVEFKLKDIGIEDIYYAILTPSQAALMLYGVPPPDPKETPELMREIFVKKEKLLEDKFVDILEENIKLRKDVEHNIKKSVSGKEIDQLLENADKYLKRIKRLFSQIEKTKEEENFLKVCDTVTSVVRDCLKEEGVMSCEENNLMQCFKEKLVDTGKIPENFFRKLKMIEKNKKDYEEQKLSKIDVKKFLKDAGELTKFLLEYIQRKKFRELESSKVRVKHGSKLGELVFMEKNIYLVSDIKEKDKCYKAEILGEKKVSDFVEISQEEFEKFIDAEKPGNAVLTTDLVENIKRILGEDIEFIINY